MALHAIRMEPPDNRDEITMRGTIRHRAAMAACAMIVAMAGSACGQTIGWLTTNFGTVDPVESYGGGTLASSGAGQYQVTFPGFGDGLDSDVQISAVDYFAEASPHYCTSAGWGSDGTNVTAYVDCFDATGALANGDFAVFYEARTAAPSSGYIAFAWANQPTTANYFPDADYAFNSSGRTIDILRTGVGAYVVAFDGAPTKGNPMVTAYGSSAAHCEVADWVKNGGYGVEVYVRCFNGAGQAADEYFDIAYAAGVSHGDGPATGAGGYAWANNAVAANYKPPLLYQFNNISTLPVKGSNSGYGIGFLELPVQGRLTFQPYLGLVTPVGSSGEFCDQNHIEQDTSKPKNPSFYLAVECFNAQGQDLNSEYTGAIISHPVG